MAKENFVTRHIGPREEDKKAMLKTVGVETIDELISQTIPNAIRLDNPLNLKAGISEDEYQEHIQGIASKNKVYKSFIGMGYYNTIVPSVIKRNILENPSWYTSYTPYQAEISQGRLEALVNFQTMVRDLTGLKIANASLLDEGTAAAEAMLMMYNKRSRAKKKNNANRFFIDKNTFPQTIEVIKSRSLHQNIELVIDDYKNFSFDEKTFGVLVQYPASDGKIEDYSDFVAKAHDNECLVAVAADILSLALLSPPGDWGADIAVGSTQRFGVPMGYGGPHAAYFATREKYKRNIPGRIIGVSKDKHENPALRMALQTREQHIKRERATSNICTAQALLASMASMYAVYHGKDGLIRIARHSHNLAAILDKNLQKMGYKQENTDYFDTIKINLPETTTQDDIQSRARTKYINLRYFDDGSVGISMDEKADMQDVNEIIAIFAEANNTAAPTIAQEEEKIYFDEKFERQSSFLSQETFNSYHSETKMMRYIKKLERKDYSLTHSMIPLGSCTMKLNAATEMLPLSWSTFTDIHPFVPEDQAEGYHELFTELENMLNEITGLSATTLQPNSGAAGEFTGLSVIKAYHNSRGDTHRDVVLVPSSAHGTNPASGVMAGHNVVIVDSDENGNINIDDLKQKAQENADNLSAFMVTYPSTHGVFESKIQEMCDIVHQNGGQVYMDGANLNAMIGLTNLKEIGADICHLNLHKTFAIPHGGGGPGVGPVSAAGHLAEFLPSHSFIKTNRPNAIPAVSAAPWGSASIMHITYGYIKMLGAEGLTETSKTAILNSNYIASALKNHFDTLYTGENGRVAHEMIIECRNFKHHYGVSEADIAKRLMDYGFHAPTLSFPVHGTLMAEPTESESKEELDRFIDAMQSIHAEIMEIKDGNADSEDNVLKNAPHTAGEVTSDNWDHAYSREKAAFPLSWIRDNKFWPDVARVDDAYGDRHLVCDCAPVETYRNKLYAVNNE